MSLETLNQVCSPIVLGSQHTNLILHTQTHWLWNSKLLDDPSPNWNHSPMPPFTLIIITAIEVTITIHIMLTMQGLVTIWGRVGGSGGFGAPDDLHPPSTAATSSWQGTATSSWPQAWNSCFLSSLSPAQLCLSMYAAPKHIAESCTFRDVNSQCKATDEN